MRSRPGLLLLAGFVAAAAVRIAWLAAFEDNWDMGTYRDFAAQAPRGSALYRDIVSYHFSPVFAFLVAGVASVATAFGFSFETGVGAVLLLADAAAAALVYRIARRNLERPFGAAAGAALLFFANPVSVLVTGFHVQFDNLAVLFLLAAIAFAGRRESAGRGAIVGQRDPLRPSVLTALSASLLFKHVTWFHPLLFVRGRLGWRSLRVAVPYLVFFASFLPYWSAREVAARRVFGYASLGEDYGLSMLGKIGAPAWLAPLVFLAAIAGAVFAFRRLELARASLLLFLVMLVFIPGIAQYYFVWPIAFGSLYAGAGYAVFTLLFSAFFLGSPDGLGLGIPHLPGWHGMWWGAVFWLLWELRAIARRKVA